MDRREWLGMIGGAGAGVVLTGECSADHGAQEKKDDRDSPVGQAHAHLCGIHLAKKDPKFQVVIQHYCVGHHEPGREGELFIQCLLFDSSSKNARLMGVEYIISDERFRSLPDDEKKYWHPHAYEVLGGGLITSGMDAQTDKTLMKTLLTSWGKAWHTWPDPKADLPIGEPLLIWSLTGDGQVREEVVAERDKIFQIDSVALGAKRRQELGLASPQVPQPKSIDEVGRMWTATGEDRPTRTD